LLRGRRGFFDGSGLLGSRRRLLNRRRLLGRSGFFRWRRLFDRGRSGTGRQRDALFECGRTDPLTFGLERGFRRGRGIGVISAAGSNIGFVCRGKRGVLGGDGERHKPQETEARGAEQEGPEFHC
jgi:hypothetical protein